MKARPRPFEAFVVEQTSPAESWLAVAAKRHILSDSFNIIQERRLAKAAILEGESVDGPRN